MKDTRASVSRPPTEKITPNFALLEDISLFRKLGLEAFEEMSVSFLCPTSKLEYDYAGP